MTKIILVFLLLIGSVFGDSIKVSNHDGSPYNGEVLIKEIGKYKVINGILANVFGGEEAFIKADINNKSLLFTVKIGKSVKMNKRITYDEDYSLFNIKFSSDFSDTDIYVDNSFTKRSSYQSGTVFVPYVKNNTKAKIIIVKDNNFVVIEKVLPKDPKTLLIVNDIIRFNSKDNEDVFLSLTSNNLKIIEPKFVEMDTNLGFTIIDNVSLVYKDVFLSISKYSNLYKNVFYKLDLDSGKLIDTDNFVNKQDLPDKSFYMIIKSNPNLEFNIDYSNLNFIDKSEFIATVEKAKAYEDSIREKNKEGNQDNKSLIVILFQLGLLFVLLYLGYYALRKMYESFKLYRVEQITALWNNMSETVESSKLTSLMLDAYDLKNQNVSKILKKAIVDFEEHITELSLIIHKYRKSLTDINDEIESINYQIDSISHALVDNKTGSADRIAALKKKLDIYNESLDELSPQGDSIKDKLEDTLLVKVSELIVAFESIIADAKLSKLERELDKNVNDFNDKMNDISNSLESDSLMKEVDYVLSIERFKNELEQKLKKVIGE